MVSNSNSADNVPVSSEAPVVVDEAPVVVDEAPVVVDADRPLRRKKT